jgi:hypothetical protein
VGTVNATSPLYPAPLAGKADLTGSSSGLSLTLVFPAPFPLTLTGGVNLLANSATFTGLPDIPLTNLTVSLSGGAPPSPETARALTRRGTGPREHTRPNQTTDRTGEDPGRTQARASSLRGIVLVRLQPLRS